MNAKENQTLQPTLGQTICKPQTRPDALAKVVDEVRQDAAKGARAYTKGAVVPKGGE